MKRTLIVSAFPGCGKTYLSENQDKLRFKFFGESKKFSFCDSDSSHWKKCENWQKQYVDDIEKKLGTVDFLFVSQHEDVLAELETRHIPFVVVAPDNSEWLSDDEKRLVKQQWFGRFVLRDNSHIKDFANWRWLNTLKDNYDAWTSVEHLTKHNPVSFFLLEQNQYLSSIIGDLYWKKENYGSYTVHSGMRLKDLEDPEDDATNAQLEKIKFENS